MKNFIIVLVSVLPTLLFAQVFSIKIDEQKVIPNSAFMLGQVKSSIIAQYSGDTIINILTKGIELRKVGTSDWFYIGQENYLDIEPFAKTVRNGNVIYEESSLFPLACMKSSGSAFNFNINNQIEIRVLYVLIFDDGKIQEIRSNSVPYSLPALSIEERNALAYMRDSIYTKYDQIRWITNIRYQEGGYQVIRELESFCQKFPNSELIPYVQMDLITTRRLLRNPNRLDVPDKKIAQNLINYFEQINLFTKKYNVDFLQSILTE